MPKAFVYKARDRSGKVLAGTVLAEDQMAAAVHIREQGYFITLLQEQKQALSVKERLELWQGVKTKDLAIFCRQFSTMIDAGLPLISCLDILSGQCESQALKKALQAVVQRVKEGVALYQALQEHPRIFPGIMVNLIEAGELGGVLDDVLSRLATHFEKEYKLNEKIKSAMTYPAVVMGIAVLVIIFILTFVLPTFVSMFANMKMELPLPTRILLDLSDLFREHGVNLAVLVVALGFAGRVLLRRTEVRRWTDRLILRLPVAGMLSRKIAIARFSRTLSTLLRGGVSIITALGVVKKTMGNLQMVEALDKSQRNVQEGQSLAQTLEISGIFTPMTLQMIAIGEESGSLDRMLEKVADFYENEVDDTVGRLSSIIEPLIVAFLGIVVGCIVIAIVIPMIDAVTNVGNM